MARTLEATARFTSQAMIHMVKRAAPALAALAAGAAIGFLLGRRNRKAQIHPAH